MRTDVSRSIAFTGEPIVRVVFCGQGGECVTVEMATAQPENDNAAIARARAVLVQTGTFELAENEYEAESDGNFDEIAVTTVSAKFSAMYVFEYRDGDGVRQVPPSNLNHQAVDHALSRIPLHLVIVGHQFSLAELVAAKRPSNAWRSRGQRPLPSVYQDAGPSLAWTTAP